MDQLLTKVGGRPVLFDEAPPLGLARRRAPREYWLVVGSAVTRRVYCNKNIVEDLCQAFRRSEIATSSALVHVHMTPRTGEERAAETVYTDEPGAHDQDACCRYDLGTGGLVELYPSERAAAAGLGVSYSAVHACNWGNIAVLDGRIVTATRYLTPYELELRRWSTGRSGCGRPQRVYAYDYTGDSIGVFASMTDAARELRIDYRAVRRGVLNPGRPQQGYYFSVDPNYRPPVVGADGMLRDGLL